MKHQEDDEQAAFFEWVSYQQVSMVPMSQVCFAIPNGGNRNAREAARFKKQGVLAGVFDVLFAYPSGDYSGLYIEFKIDDNKLSDDQELFKRAMLSLGYQCVTCFCFLDAVDEVKIYLSRLKTVSNIEITKMPKGKHRYKAVCRSMSKTFVTYKGAVGWLRRRGFNASGERI